MRMETRNAFDQKLMSIEAGNPFPYVDPPRDWKPPFIVDAENYLQWFEKILKSTIGQGYWISFIVGDPGSGKSHILCYLNYLFNEARKFRGLYSVFSAGQTRITSRDLWIDFFLNSDVVKRAKELLPIEVVRLTDFRRIDIKQYIVSYLEGNLQIDGLKDDAIQSLAAGVSDLLAKNGAGMCMVIDNVDEYFRYLSSLHERDDNLSDKEKEQRELADLQYFFGTLRTTCRDMPNFLLLLAVTSPVYDMIIKKHIVDVDRTFAGRIQYQSETLKPLNKSQSFELVHKYTEWWSENSNVIPPLIEECTVEDSMGNKYSIYPFSRSAIEEIYEVTGQFARDIKTICNECINHMKVERRAWIVKDAYLAYAIEEAHKKRPQIIPPENFEKFKKRRVKWLKETMRMKLEQIARDKYIFGIDPEKLIDILDVYAKDLGIATEVAPTIQNQKNLQWINTRYLKIWRYRGEKRILVSHIFSNAPPLGNTYFRHIEWRDISDAISYVQTGVATHILFLTRWCGGYSTATRQYWYELSRYQPIMEIMSLDNDFIFKMIVGAIEDGGENRKDMVEHINEYFLNLRETLDRLTTRSIPPHAPPFKDKRLIDRG